MAVKEPLAPFLLATIVSLASYVACRSAQETASHGRIPQTLFKPLCDILMIEESLAAEQTVHVLPRTRPIFRMIAVKFAYTSDEEGVTPDHVTAADALDKAYKDQFRAMEIGLPSINVTRCQLLRTEKSFGDYYLSDELLLELSSPVENPYSEDGKEPYGLFARLSLGGRSGGGWYWVALKQGDEGWEVLRVIPLAIFDG
jgi:hypothetical protein